jgi:cytochrome c nitrite reductase small subunit
MNDERRGFIGRILAFLVPPPRWRLPVFLLFAVFCGLSAVVLYISNAGAYLSDDPAACMNCHIMAPQYATWDHSSHARKVTCNDCHVPQENVFRTYAFKASDGLRHAFMFTFRLEPQVIRVHSAGKSVIQENCIRCHENAVGMTTIQFVSYEDAVNDEGHLCWDCHRETPHGRVNSLSSVPYARVPIPTTVAPTWMQDSTEAEHTQK